MKNDKNHRFVVHDSTGREIGVKIKVNPRSRRLILKIDERSREGVLVIPRESDRPAGIAFATERADWFSSRLDGMPEPKPFVHGAIVPVRGRPTKLSAEGTGRRAQLIESPSGDMLLAPGAEATFSDRVKRFLKTACKSDLEDAVVRYCDRLDVEARRISVKDTRSRWGSCTSDGRLAFSWRLIHAPSDVLDYVAAHECAHLIEMNHSHRFWDLVEQIYGDHRPARRWLKRHGAGLHAFGLDAVPDTGSATGSERASAVSF